MKKLLRSSNPFILLLVPFFILAMVALFYQLIKMQLFDKQAEVTRLFNRRTVFEFMGETVKISFKR